MGLPFGPWTRASDRALTTAKLELPPGSALEDTRLAAERARALLAPMPDITGSFTAVGSVSGHGPMGEGAAKDVRLATLHLKLTYRRDRDRLRAWG